MRKGFNKEETVCHGVKRTHASCCIMRLYEAVEPWKEAKSFYIYLWERRHRQLSLRCRSPKPDGNEISQALLSLFLVVRKVYYHDQSFTKNCMLDCLITKFSVPGACQRALWWKQWLDLRLIKLSECDDWVSEISAPVIVPGVKILG